MTKLRGISDVFPKINLLSYHCSEYLYLKPKSVRKMNWRPFPINLKLKKRFKKKQ